MWYNFLFLQKVSYSVRRTFIQPTDISILLLVFSFSKDLMHCAPQILLIPELFRHSAVDIPLPFPLEHQHTLGQKCVPHSPSRSDQGRWCEETAIAGYMLPEHLQFLRDEHYTYSREWFLKHVILMLLNIGRRLKLGFWGFWLPTGAL